MRALSFLIPLTTKKHEKKVTWMVAADKQNFLPCARHNIEASELILIQFMETG